MRRLGSFVVSVVLTAAVLVTQPAASSAAIEPGVDALWDTSVTPSVPNWPDENSVEVGVGFVTSEDILVLGVRFHKGDLNTGTHIGSLWNGDGSLLATGTFENETADGWQDLVFDTPVAMSAGDLYIASYFAPAGYYSAVNDYFSVSLTTGPVTALAGTDAQGNGVYTYGDSSTFPEFSFRQSNYWISPLWTTDSDNDGVGDHVDNCLNDANSNQADNDDDGLGDVCDTDDDNDGFDDETEIEEGADPFDAGSVPPVAATNASIEGLRELMADPALDPEAVNEVDDAIDKLVDALDEFVKGHTHHAIGKMADAIEKLEKAEQDAPGLDLTLAKATVAAAARTAARSHIDEARTIHPYDEKVAEAEVLLAAGDGLRDAGDYSAAVEKYKKAAEKVKDIVPAAPLDASTLALIAASNAEISGLAQLLADPELDPEAVNEVDDAIDKLVDAIDEFVKGHTHHAIDKMADGIEKLEKAEQDAPDLDLTLAKASLTGIARTAARSDIDEAWAIDPDDEKVAEAEVLLVEGDGLRDAGDYSAAAEKYRKAAEKVKDIVQ